ncbi:MAG: hypothetical protein JWR52_824 [Marmoricola sp.]|nr:hypothetical protein [Marmoricola sp.]
MRTRLLALLAIAAMVTGTALVVTASPGTAATFTFTERWCSGLVQAPCVISATRNGVSMHAGDPIQIQMIPTQSQTDFNYTEFIVGDPTDTVHLATTDIVSVYMNLGTLRPDYTEGYAGRPTVHRISSGGGTYKAVYTGHPVLLTSGCTDTYPNYCKDTAQTQSVVFNAEIHQLKTDHSFTGFDRSQSADTVDGVYLVSTPTGDYLESHWDNSRYQTDGSTIVTAQARFRIPYSMLISDFKIPNPGTMVASSLVGTVNGSPATYSFSQDPLGGAVFVDISRVTFPPGNARVAEGGQVASHPRDIRVKRGAITPTRPVLTHVTRVAGTRARVTFSRARARGAIITGYQARCQSAGHRTLTASGHYPTVVVTGLTRGRRYLCSVRAKSRAGYGAWSLRIRI